jgi:hypothetical protein
MRLRAYFGVQESGDGVLRKDAAPEDLLAVPTDDDGVGDIG